MALLLEIKVVPQSGRLAMIRDKGGFLKCYLKSPPEDGKANHELVKFLAKSLGINFDQIKIVQGATSRKKVLKIDIQLSLEALLQKLGIETQTGI